MNILNHEALELYPDNFLRLLKTPYGAFKSGGGYYWVSEECFLNEIYSYGSFPRKDIAALYFTKWEYIFDNLTADEKFIISFNFDEIDALKIKDSISNVYKLKKRF